MGLFLELYIYKYINVHVSETFPILLIPSMQFTMMTVGMYKEIFKEMIEYLVDRIESNYALQIIPNSFLANPTTSPAFASILLKFLLNRMEKMGGM